MNYLYGEVACASFDMNRFGTMMDNPLQLTNAPGRVRVSAQAFPMPGERFRHPAVLILLLGGSVGSTLNLATTVALHRTLGWSPYVAFFVGTFVNLLFHHLYYALVFVHQEARLKPALPIQLLSYVGIALGGAAVLWLFQWGWGLDFIPATVTTVPVASASARVTVAWSCSPMR